MAADLVLLRRWALSARLISVTEDAVVPGVVIGIDGIQSSDGGPARVMIGASADDVQRLARDLLKAVRTSRKAARGQAN